MKRISLTNMLLNLPFAALRAFEAVARHGSFSEAADELGALSIVALLQNLNTLLLILMSGSYGIGPTNDLSFGSWCL